MRGRAQGVQAAHLPPPQPLLWPLQGASPWSPGCLSPQGESSVLPLLLTPQVKALGYDGSSPPSVPSWLDSLGLQDYVHSFLASGYSSIDTVKNLWELELVNVSTAHPGPAHGAGGPVALTPPLPLPRSSRSTCLAIASGSSPPWQTGPMRSRPRSPHGSPS